MERAKGIMPASSKPISVSQTDKWLIALILLFHTVGLAGFALAATMSLFLALVPFHLLLMAALILKSHKGYSFRFFIFFMVTYLTGYGVELIGTGTGLLFGNYAYGATLGIKISGVPLLMGILWFLMIYPAGVTMKSLGIKHKLFRVTGGAALLTLLDWLIEPVAMRFDYWNWHNGIIPFTNYLCWFIISFILLWVFEWARFKKQSGVAVVFVITQFIFFIAMRQV